MLRFTPFTLQLGSFPFVSQTSTLSLTSRHQRAFISLCILVASRWHYNRTCLFIDGKVSLLLGLEIRPPHGLPGIRLTCCLSAAGAVRVREGGPARVGEQSQAPGLLRRPAARPPGGLRGGGARPALRPAGLPTARQHPEPPPRGVPGASGARPGLPGGLAEETYEVPLSEHRDAS